MPPTIPEVVIGRLSGFTPAGGPLIDYPGNPFNEAVEALTTAPLDAVAVGRDVALLFADGEVSRPVVIGLIRRSGQEDAPACLDVGEVRGQEFNVELDGQRLVLSAGQEIVLKCGNASITLTQAGKVLINGSYLLSRSTGVNRIKGGSIQLN